MDQPTQELQPGAERATVFATVAARKPRFTADPVQIPLVREVVVGYLRIDCRGASGSSSLRHGRVLSASCERSTLTS